MLQIGPLTIDFTPLLDAAAISPWYGAWVLFAKGGWIPIVIAIVVGFKWMWQLHIARGYAAKWKWVLLAIDVPRENVQSPRAVENIMAHLAGAHVTADLIEKYITGFGQEFFSLEVVSTEGSVRFFIRTVEKNRDLVESAIYAQYPSAEIAEVPEEEDYVRMAPDYYPDPSWQLWGTEFIPVKNQCYPIRTYTEFQDETAEEAGFKDPMAALLETMGSLREGEHLWFSVVITPVASGSWQDKCFKEVAKLAGIPSEYKPTLLGRLMGLPGDLMIKLIDALLPGTPATDQKIKEELPSKMLYLTPGEREVIESIEYKAAKIGFATKIRVVYLAKREVYHRPRAGYGVIGAIKQVNTEDKNALKPDLKVVGTHAHYFFTEWRKNWKRRKVIQAYKARSNWRGRAKYILNIEELATLWHFPVAESVKAPLLSKAKSKRGEPPVELPMEGGIRAPGARTAARRGESPKALPEELAPDNLPIG